MVQNIIYEDEELLVVYKPAKIAVQTKRFGQMDMESGGLSCGKGSSLSGGHPSAGSAGRGTAGICENAGGGS